MLAGVLGCSWPSWRCWASATSAAPSDSALAALDPTHRAVTEFTAVVSAFPLDGRVSAALQGQPPSTSSPAVAPDRGGAAREGAVGGQGDRLLVQAGQAGDELTYSATQFVGLSRDDERITNIVRVANSGGSGTELSPGGSGHDPAGAATYIASDSSTRMADADLIDRLAAPVHVAGVEGAVVQPIATAYVVEAVEPTATPADGDLSGVMARWWIDSRSKLLLGQETYDGRGNVVVASRLTDLRFGAAADVNGPDGRTSPAGQPPRTTATLTLSRAGQLRRDGWICAERLAGLSLLRLRTDQTDDPTSCTWSTATD